MREGRIDLGREDRADAQEGVGGEAIASVGLAPGDGAAGSAFSIWPYPPVSHPRKVHGPRVRPSVAPCFFSACSGFAWTHSFQPSVSHSPQTLRPTQRALA